LILETVKVKIKTYFSPPN